MKRLALTVFAVALLGAACGDKGYKAHPVTPPPERQRLDVNEMTEEERLGHECFEIEAWDSGFIAYHEDELPGVYCKVGDG